MKKSKPKAKMNDVFLHVGEKKMFIVTSRDKQPSGNLYTLKEIGPSNQISYKRYYEDKLMANCEKLKNSKAAKVLYGKKK